MKYDSNTSNVDRWHGMSDKDMSQGYKTVEGEGFAPESGNSKQLNGGMQPRNDKPLAKQSD